MIGKGSSGSAVGKGSLTRCVHAIRYSQIVIESEKLMLLLVYCLMKIKGHNLASQMAPE